MGMELEELWQQEKIDVQHLLVIDSYTTWWKSVNPIYAE
jgi:hypothetical protein